MKNQKRQKVTYLLLILSLFGFLISSFAYGYTQKTEEISGEFKGNFRLLAGPKNTVHLFYLSNFISYDFGFDDLVVMSAVDLNFSAPIRVGGETNSYHEDRARLLNAIEFENSGIITFYTDPAGLDTWGFYGREWNSANHKWDSTYPLFTGSDLQAHFGPQKNDSDHIYFGSYLPAFVDAQRQLYVVVQQDFFGSPKFSNPWFFQIDLDSSSKITKKEIPIFSEIAIERKLDTKSNLIIASNSSNIVIQLENGSQSLFTCYNGSEFSSNRVLPFSPARWEVLNNGNLVLGGFDLNQSIFRVYTLLHEDWVQKEFTISENDWINILDWELNNDKNIHILAETLNGLDYAILNETELVIRNLNQFNLTNIVDMSLSNNGIAYLGGMNTDDNLGVIKLSRSSPLEWCNATGWDSLVECGYPDCLEVNMPILMWEESIVACLIIISLKRYKRIGKRIKK
jgi:hypothetical protein